MTPVVRDDAGRPPAVLHGHWSLMTRCTSGFWPATAAACQLRAAGASSALSQSLLSGSKRCDVTTSALSAGNVTDCSAPPIRLQHYWLSDVLAVWAEVLSLYLKYKMSRLYDCVREILASLTVRQNYVVVFRLRLVISLEAESIKFRKLRVEEAPCRFVASLQNIVWFTTCKQW